MPTEDSEGGGSEQHSNFHQLLLLRASIIDMMQRRTRKYTDHHIQNATDLGSRSFAQNS